MCVSAHSLDSSATSMAETETEAMYAVFQFLVYQIFFGFLTATIASLILESDASRQVRATAPRYTLGNLSYPRVVAIWLYNARMA